jgi:hypothetical protein
MPAKTEKQRRFMAMCANNPGKARGKCPSKSVAREFMHKRKKKRTMPKPDKHGFY